MVRCDSWRSPPLRRGSILCRTRFTKSGQEPYSGFRVLLILSECGLKAAMLSGRAVYILGPLHL